MKRGSRSIRSALTIAVTAALILTGGAAAQAATVETESTTLLNATALVPAGFDRVVAEANGYAIVADGHGGQHSIPVSADAVEFERRLEQDSSAQSRTTWVQGPCGNSWINAVSRGNSKTISTGFVVPRPVIAKTWTVQVWGWSGLPAFTWAGGSGPSWSSSWSFSLSGGDFANVLPGSNVVMNNGAVCVSGSPGENFHS